MKLAQITKLIVEDICHIVNTGFVSNDGIYTFISEMDISVEPRQALLDLSFKRDVIFQTIAIIDAALVSREPSFLIDEDPEDIDHFKFVEALTALKCELREQGASVKIALGGIYSL